MLAAAAVPVHSASAAAMRQPVIRIEGLTKRFAIPRRWVDLLTRRRPAGVTTALDGVSLTVSRGDIIGLLGPNGAGKTTLLKIVSTLILPDSGAVEVEGIDVVRSPTEARRLVSPVSPDERSLEWRLSANENLRFHGALHGLSGAGLRARIHEVIAIVGLGDSAGNLVGTFSSGMKQRLLIARGLLSRPKVLLLDEPTRSLDPIAARAFRQFLRQEVAGRQGCTILLATHDPDEALDLCDRVAILDHGRVLASGTTSELVCSYSEECYRVWVGSRRSVNDLESIVPVLLRRHDLDTDEWFVAEVGLRGQQPAQELLAMLVHHGIPIGRFEKVQPTLADLMQRVVDRNGRPRNA